MNLALLQSHLLQRMSNIWKGLHVSGSLDLSELGSQFYFFILLQVISSLYLTSDFALSAGCVNRPRRGSDWLKNEVLDQE
jgi:hypothetical protein